MLGVANEIEHIFILFCHLEVLFCEVFVKSFGQITCLCLFVQECLYIIITISEPFVINVLQISFLTL